MTDHSVNFLRTESYQKKDEVKVREGAAKRNTSMCVMGQNCREGNGSRA